jgi:hypothetical protein
MSTTANPPSSAPPGLNPTGKAILSLMQDPRQVRSWLSVTPNWLRAAIVAIALLSAAFALAVRHATLEQSQTIKTIQVDSAPSILAGQRLRASLADMHSNLANELLQPGAPDDLDDAAPVITEQGKELSVDEIFKRLLDSTDAQGVDALKDSAPTIFRKRRSEAARLLVSAAKNITYPGEVPPVWTMVNSLARYEEHAGRAELLCDPRNVQSLDERQKAQNNAKILAEHQAADEIMRTKLLPATVELVRVNQKALDDAYAADKKWALAAWLVVLLTGGGLLAAIVGLQFLLFKRMRRVLNPPLLIAAALTAGGCLWALAVLWQSSADIKVAKEDAFDSIKVLEAARAVAYDANGDESRYLLVAFRGGTQDQVQACDKSFRDKAAMIAAYPSPWNVAQLRDESKSTGKAPAALKGYLADELNNITFDHELDAAVESLQTFVEYLKIDRQIRDLALRNKQKEALELCVGTDAGQSDWAFSQFDKALGRTIKINLDQFDKSLYGAADRLTGLDWLLPLGLALAVSLLAFLGLRPRLKEYAV